MLSWREEVEWSGPKKVFSLLEKRTMPKSNGKVFQYSQY